MGLGDGPDDKKDASTRQRRFSRASSVSSKLSCEDVMIPLRDGTGSVGGRKRTPSGKSVVSRTISLAEYHSDLKPSLRDGLTRNLLLLSFIIYFGSSFLFGYNIGVLNQPDKLIQKFFNETYTDRYGSVSPWALTFLWSFTTAIYFPGGMIGAFCSGFMAKKLGRRKSIMLSHIPAFIGAVLQTLCVIAKSPELLIIGRFITGINCGVAAQLAPMFLSEIAPYNLRGALGTGNQLFVTVGIFIGSVLGLQNILGTEKLWPYLLLFNAFPAMVSLIAFFFLPDSPRYLMLEANDRIGAEKALRFLRQRLDVTVDIEEMETEASETQAGGEDNEKYSMMRLLSEPSLRLPLLVTVVLQISQQFSGINAIFFYSNDIYEQAGVDPSSIQYAVIGTNAVNVVMTFITVPLMDKVGRRPLLLYPMIAMVIDMAIITPALHYQGQYTWTSYISIVCVIFYVVCFAVGLGPIPWMMAPELFRQGPRAMAMSVAGVTNWLCTTIVAISFPPVVKVINEFTFVVFLALMVVFTIFVFFKAPETKNKTFEEIASLFQPGGTIEVEEVVEDVFDESKLQSGDEEEENTRLVSSPPARNGSVGSVNSESRKASAGDVTVSIRDEERRNLTKSMEGVNSDPHV